MQKVSASISVQLLRNYPRAWWLVPKRLQAPMPQRLQRSMNQKGLLCCCAEWPVQQLGHGCRVAWTGCWSSDQTANSLKLFAVVPQSLHLQPSNCSEPMALGCVLIYLNLIISDLHLFPNSFGQTHFRPSKVFYQFTIFTIFGHVWRCSKRPGSGDRDFGCGDREDFGDGWPLRPLLPVTVKSKLLPQLKQKQKLTLWDRLYHCICIQLSTCFFTVHQFDTCLNLQNSVHVHFTPDAKTVGPQTAVGSSVSTCLICCCIAASFNSKAYWNLITKCSKIFEIFKLLRLFQIPNLCLGRESGLGLSSWLFTWSKTQNVARCGTQCHAPGSAPLPMLGASRAALPAAVPRLAWVQLRV